MNLLIMGLPGSGKGTQAEKIVEEYNVEHLSTGDMFRNEMKSDSELGKEIRSYVDNGNLVPDELTLRLLKNEISKSKYENGFLLDGYPRNESQAQSLDEMLTTINKKIDSVIYLDLDEEIIKTRLVNRLVCPTCGASYHKINVKPKVEWLCDNDNTELIQREDDKIEKIEHRLKVANEQTLPVITYYEKLDLVKHIKILEQDSVDFTFNLVRESLS